MILTFDLLIPKLIASFPCPVDHLCQFALRFQNVLFTSLGHERKEQRQSESRLAGA